MKINYISIYLSILTKNLKLKFRNQKNRNINARKYWLITVIIGCFKSPRVIEKGEFLFQEKLYFCTCTFLWSRSQLPSKMYKFVSAPCFCRSFFVTFLTVSVLSCIYGFHRSISVTVLLLSFLSKFLSGYVNLVFCTSNCNLFCLLYYIAPLITLLVLKISVGTSRW